MDSLGKDIWHDLGKDPSGLPGMSGRYLVRYMDGTMDMVLFMAGDGRFATSWRIAAWTDRYMQVGSLCRYCCRAGWTYRSGRMVYGCDMPYCQGPRQERGMDRA
ncbi:MAG: hypothetical protein HFG22_16555 [Lachnospiraceae bacterium]|nr:hypothetical protein [Lachnospiraceae bacterium]